jgi:hypothetical protein
MLSKEVSEFKVFNGLFYEFFIDFDYGSSFSNWLQFDWKQIIAITKYANFQFH